ncbi:hypothetical protein C1645_758964 [Glomus cerebriforme]|uniref:Uncharacterized protein n=1 Tax=Glomus cerebriforme TaxID=658196 RepID=A0A397TEG5_9GLOM|nr:hypothetical protein C1645_758964 [Glomus cerebriforme]
MTTQNTQATATSSSSSSLASVSNEISQLEKYRYYWWKTGNMHPKAKWEEVNLPYELAKDVPFDTYVEQTDKYNIHGFWEWENNTVRVIELPSSFHENCVNGIVRQISRQLGAVEGTNVDIFNYGATTTRSRGSGKEADASFRPVSKPQVNRGGSDGNNQPWPNLVVEVAYTQSEADVRNKIENYWLRAGRAHDAILIKIEPPTAPDIIPKFMTLLVHYSLQCMTSLQPTIKETPPIFNPGKELLTFNTHAFIMGCQLMFGIHHRLHYLHHFLNLTHHFNLILHLNLILLLIYLTPLSLTYILFSIKS